MMKKYVRILCACLVVLLLFCVCGCSATEPPTVSEIQGIFDRDRENILLVTDYFVSSGYSNLMVRDDDCKNMFADMKDVAIEDEAVVTALKALAKNGYQTFSKSGNTIEFCVWSRLSDVGCGMAYSIDGEAIQVDYLTESAPLAEDGWFYFVDDFNEWRAQNR